MGLFHSLAVGLLPLIPRPLMRRLSARYIAGETLEAALAKLEELRDQGYSGILDLLGEDVTDEATAREVASTYCLAADRIAERGLDVYVSIKPTHLGLSFSKEVCRELYARVAAHAKSRGLFMRVEMEDHPTTDATIEIFQSLRQEFDNVGIVLQSRLFRTPDDIEALLPAPLAVRMVKGIYLEPEEIAHTDADAIRDAYVSCSVRLFEAGGRVSLATHDGPMADRLLSKIAELGVGAESYEFQVLLGVQEVLWKRWLEAGHPVRVYVPYGPEWRAYSQRRLRKNPEIFGHLVRATVRSLFGRDPS